MLQLNSVFISCFQMTPHPYFTLDHRQALRCVPKLADQLLEALAAFTAQLPSALLSTTTTQLPYQQPPAAASSRSAANTVQQILSAACWDLTAAVKAAAQLTTTDGTSSAPQQQLRAASTSMAAESWDSEVRKEAATAVLTGAVSKYSARSAAGFVIALCSSTAATGVRFSDHEVWEALDAVLTLSAALSDAPEAAASASGLLNYAQHLTTEQVQQVTAYWCMDTGPLLLSHSFLHCLSDQLHLRHSFFIKHLVAVRSPS